MHLDFFFDKCEWASFEAESCFVAQTGLKFVILLPQPLKAGITGMSFHAQLPLLLFI